MCGAFCISGCSRRIVSAGELVADARQGHVCDPFCVSALGRYSLIAMHPGPCALVSRRRVRPENPPRPAGSPDPACRGGPRCTPDFPLLEDMPQAQRVRQVEQRQLMPQVGAHTLAPPPPYRQGIGLDTASYLRPRQGGLPMETRQTLREVLRKDVDASAVVRALSRHRSGPLQSSIGLFLQGLPRAFIPVSSPGAGPASASRAGDGR